MFYAWIYEIWNTKEFLEILILFLTQAWFSSRNETGRDLKSRVHAKIEHIVTQKPIIKIWWNSFHISEWLGGRACSTLWAQVSWERTHFVDHQRYGKSNKSMQNPEHPQVNASQARYKTQNREPEKDMSQLNAPDRNPEELSAFSQRLLGA